MIKRHNITSQAGRSDRREWRCSQLSTIGRRIETAIKHLVEKDYENGLIQVCIAIDGTAKKKWPRDKPGMRIRKFVDEYEALIWQFASGGGIKLLGSGRARGKISITDETPDLLY